MRNRQNRWLPDFPGKFCENQFGNDGQMWCGQKLVEGYKCYCPYQKSDLTDADGDGSLRPQRNPQPGADGVCRDYEPVEPGKATP